MKEEAKAAKKRKEKIPKVYNLVPSISLEKPVIQNVDYYNLELTWLSASLPANATPTAIR